MNLHEAVAEHLDVLRLFISRDMTFDDFETAFLIIYRRDLDRVQLPAQRPLGEFFISVDLTVEDGAAIEPPEMSVEELRAEAIALLREAGF